MNIITDSLLRLTGLGKQSMRALTILAVALVLSGCATTPSPDDDDVIRVVASTNVYGDIAEAIGGDVVEVVSIVSDPAQDPHSVEGSARTQLALAQADIVIENGGGYDDWIDILLAGSGNDDVVVVNVAAVSGYSTEGDFNEHLWYDFAAMQRLALELRVQFGSLAGIELPSSDFGDRLFDLQVREAVLAEEATDVGVAITEAVPVPMLTASGLRILTPPAFSEAIEEGSDVPPLALKETVELFSSGEARLLVYNSQTTSPETEKVKDAALAAGVPVVAVTETLPPGLSYLEWMSQNLDAIATALGVEV